MIKKKATKLAAVNNPYFIEIFSIRFFMILAFGYNILRCPAQVLFIKIHISGIRGVCGKFKI